MIVHVEVNENGFLKVNDPKLRGEELILSLPDRDEAATENKTKWETIKEDGILSLRERRAFMRLPIEQRREIMEKQAKELTEHYTHDAEWKDIEGGDIVDY